MRLPFAVGMLVALEACARAGTLPTAESPAVNEGTYEFTASLPGQTTRGTLKVNADTVVLLDAQDCGLSYVAAGEIQVACRSTLATSLDSRFQSNPVAFLRFDRRNPIAGARWTMSVPVRRTREVCDRTEVRSGREVCVARKLEPYETTESRTGSVHVSRVP